jgi:exosortase A-associated hydrolase 2
MNKSRRMVALQARALALAGWTVLQIDLFGCGDSDGDFHEGSWQQWLSDILEASSWLREQTGQTPALWGLRSGCLLAAQAAGVDATSSQLLLWQPVVSGRQYLQQFLRLKVAGQMLGGNAEFRVGTAQLRGQLERGETVEVAGYPLSPQIAFGLEAAELAPPAAAARIAWLEIGSEPKAEPSPVASSRVAKWRASGHRVAIRIVDGLPFWQTQEITECPALIEATLLAVEEWES